MRCYGCGVDKDLAKLEVSPHAEEDGIIDEPLPPLCVLECQAAEPISPTDWGFKAVVVCHECFHRLSPDMWISQRGWESLEPRVPFAELPKPLIVGKWTAENYPELQGLLDGVTDDF